MALTAASGVGVPQDATTTGTKHIAVCICTYKRPVLLKNLLLELAGQDTNGRFTYSIVVADNDCAQSAKSIVEDFAAMSTVPVKYCLEPRQNIALARNRTIANANADFVAFIDDDEFPTKQWLFSLFVCCTKRDVAGVLGPVLPHFGDEAPQWVIKGKFYDRPQHATGLVLNWTQTRTGNTLLQSSLFASDSKPFSEACLEGSDQEFFKRMMQEGKQFIWCNEAVVYEVVPPARWKRSFLIRRALFRGVFSLRNHGFPLPLIARSLIAAPTYTLALPVALIFGQARFMTYVFKLSYHTGRLLAVVGLNPIKRPYVSD